MAVLTIESKKERVALIGIAVVLLESILKMIWSAFPLTEALAAQVPLAIAFMGIQATADIKEMKYGQNNNISR